PFVIAFAAALVMAWVLAGIMGHLGQLSIKNGVISGAFCWLGFTIPAMTANYTFGRRRPLLLLIDGGYWLAALVVMGAIIGGVGIRRSPPAPLPVRNERVNMPAFAGPRPGTPTGLRATPSARHRRSPPLGRHPM